MADGDQTGDGAAQADAAPPKKSKLKLIIIAVVVLAAGGGAGAYFMMGAGHHEEAKHAEVVAPKPLYVEVPDMLVNLSANAGERIQYLKVKAVLEVKDEKLVEQIKPSMPRVTDLFTTYLRELRPSDLNGSAGMFRLREEMVRRVNLAVAPGQVNAVLFKELVIQ